ncbi:MAG: serine hydrolase [Gemmatimonadetes bacterium]|nr:serine hydrolase [Gemmatimonadota bacterium]
MKPSTRRPVGVPLRLRALAPALLAAGLASSPACARAAGAAPGADAAATAVALDTPRVASAADAARRLDAYVARAVADWHVPGLAIAVVRGDSVVFAKGYGVRELGKAEAVDIHTRFAIGSTTKAMTVAALAMLVDEGKIRWDEPVIDVLPDFRLYDPYVTREVTIRDLLTHRTGLGNADLLWIGNDYPGEEVIRRVRYLKLAHPFRAVWDYQNIMYAVAGDVVAAASGMPWEQFVRTRIWQPLGMNETEATLADVAGKPDVASPHDSIGGRMKVIANRPVDPVKSAGSVWSSVSDMSKWMRFVLDSARVGGKRLISAEQYREIFTPQIRAPMEEYPALQLSRPHGFSYGLGWFIQDYAGEWVWMHTGSIDGMSAIIGLLPDRKLGVYVLANRDHAELRHALMYRAFDLFTGRPDRDWSRELLTLFSGIRERARARQAEREKTRHADVGPSLPLGAYAGVYSDSTFGAVRVQLRGDSLRLAYGKGVVGTLEHWEYDTFRAHLEDERQDPILVTFLPDGAGGVSAVRLMGVTFRREATPAPVP